MAIDELLTELERIGIDVHHLNPFNDRKELESLAGLIKQQMMRRFKEVYNSD